MLCSVERSVLRAEERATPRVELMAQVFANYRMIFTSGCACTTVIRGGFPHASRRVSCLLLRKSCLLHDLDGILCRTALVQFCLWHF